MRKKVITGAISGAALGFAGLAGYLADSYVLTAMIAWVIACALNFIAEVNRP